MTSHTHHCPGGCGRPLVNNMLACNDCWLRVPGRLRGRVAAAQTHRRRLPVAYQEALAAVLAWYRTNPLRTTS